MYQIDGPYAATVIPTPATPGPNPNGFFQGANAQMGITATTVDADWLNAIQGELIAVLTAASITPLKSNRAQLLAAINALIALGITNNNFIWNTITTDTQLVPNQGYYTNSGGSINLTLPVLCAKGQTIKIRRVNGAFVILQNTGQQIHWLDKSTTAGVTGHITSQMACETLDLECAVANTLWIVVAGNGNPDLA